MDVFHSYVIACQLFKSSSPAGGGTFPSFSSLLVIWIFENASSPAAGVLLHVCLMICSNASCGPALRLNLWRARLAQEFGPEDTFQSLRC